MPTVRVEETVDVPIDALFAVLSDHGRYDRFPGVSSSELIREGASHRNGVGAVRRIGLGGPVVLDEEILEFDAPNEFAYRITRIRPLPLRHEIGRVKLTAVGADRTTVEWTSDFEVPLPIVGAMIAKRLVGQLTQGFKAMIRSAAKLAAA